MRIGGAHSLDLSDYYPQKQQLELVHRPDEDTTLKLGSNGERIVALSEQTCAVLDDWIRVNRPDVEDEYGRNPLFTTVHGRAAKSTLREHVYKITQPCHRTGECPHGRSLASCEDKGLTASAGCPSSVSPHAIRTDRITSLLDRGAPKEVVSGRTGVSEDVLSDYYDVRDPASKAELRRDHLDKI
ncbi:XerD/XerC family integrase [Halomicrobium sp. LC1Hm]|nr:XerD/XerC family integrase [Halomicrobium sp. LC1Hm]